MITKPKLSKGDDRQFSYRELYLETLEKVDLRECEVAEILHEEIGSELMAIRMMVKQALMDEQQKRVINEEINNVLNKLKVLSNQMNPLILSELGISEAIRKKCKLMNEEHGVVIRYTEDGDQENPLSRKIQSGLYKAVSEVIHFIIESGQPSKIFVNALNKPAKYSIRIEDDGQGVAAYSTKDKYNKAVIKKIHGRLLQMNACFKLERHGRGSVITINIDK